MRYTLFPVYSQCVTVFPCLPSRHQATTGQMAALQRERHFAEMIEAIRDNTTIDGKAFAQIGKDLKKGASASGADWLNIVTPSTDGGPWLKVLCAEPAKLKQMLAVVNAASNNSLIGCEFEAPCVQVWRDVISQSWHNSTPDHRAAGAIVRNILSVTANMAEPAARAAIDNLCIAGGARPCDRLFGLVWERLLVLYVAAHTHALACAFCPTDRSAVPDIRWRELFACVYRVATSVCNAVDLDQLKASYVSLHAAFVVERNLWFALNAAAAVPGVWVQYAGPVPPNSANNHRGGGNNNHNASKPTNTGMRGGAHNGKKSQRPPCATCVKAGQLDFVARSHDVERCIAVKDGKPLSQKEISAALKAMREEKKKG